jgi:hypothetical protein
VQKKKKRAFGTHRYSSYLLAGILPAVCLIVAFTASFLEVKCLSNAAPLRRGLASLSTLVIRLGTVKVREHVSASRPRVMKQNEIGGKVAFQTRPVLAQHTSSMREDAFDWG